MPLYPSFVPLVQEIVTWCVGGQLKQQNLLVGEPLSAAIATPVAQAPLTVQSPDGHSHPAQVRPAGDYATLNYADTTQSGIYVARFGPPVNHSETFAVNVDTAESDLTPADPDELRDKLWPGVPFTYRTSRQDAGLGAAGGPVRGGTRLHVDLLYAALGLLFFETWLGWKMGYHRKDEG